MVGGGADVADGEETTIRWCRSTDTCSTFAKADVGSCGVIFLFFCFLFLHFTNGLFYPTHSFLSLTGRLLSSFASVIHVRISMLHYYKTIDRH